MPQLTINGKVCEFEPGQNILQVALDHEIEIPHYCYHPSLSVVANCRICLAEVWAPNPRNEGKLEPIPKLVPTCQTMASEGQVVYTDSPKAIGNQKSVMEYLLINHPVDCPVCDQAGECHLQDYSYQYGRSKARFQEQKIKQPKKDVGPGVLLYSDRCIMCTRCVRFTREITETDELIVDGRGAYEQIDVFPGLALDNPLAGNVVDLCPVGALLDKDFLFKQRVWELERTPSVDGLTASGDNLWVSHAKGTVHRIKPRVNLDVNRYWITDEVRYGWKHVHAEERLRIPMVRGVEPPQRDTDVPAHWRTALERAGAGVDGASSRLVVVSPMLSCEDAFQLADWASGAPGETVFAVGPIPVEGEDRTFKDGFTLVAEKAPNARGVRRVLESFGGEVLDFEGAVARMTAGTDEAVVITGGYPSDWMTDDFVGAVGDGVFLLLIDLLPSRLDDRADVVLPGASWLEKSGTFVNRTGLMQAFDRAIVPVDFCKSEAQIAMDLAALREGTPSAGFNPAMTRQRLAGERGLEDFLAVTLPVEDAVPVTADMEYVEL